MNFEEEQRAEKPCKQVASWISREMKDMSNQLFPKRSEKRAGETERERERVPAVRKEMAEFQRGKAD